MRVPDNGRACHPRIRAESLRHYLLDDIGDAGITYEIATGMAAVAINPNIPPQVVTGCTPRARRFTGFQTGLVEVTDDAALLAALQADCTVAVLFRPTEELSTPGALFVHGGPQNGATGSNFALSLFLLANGGLSTTMMSGAGVTQQTEFSDYIGQPFVWTLAHLRKHVTGGGLCTLDLVINGSPVQSISSRTNSTGGSAGLFRIGHSLSGEEYVQSVPTADIAGLYVVGRRLTDDECVDDWRRVARFPFWTRPDLSVLVRDVASAERDLVCIDGIDFVDSVKVADSTDDATKTARVTLIRERELLSLAPLVTSTKPNLASVEDPASFFAPLLLPSGPIDIRAARMPLGLRAREGDFTSIFRGAIDEVDPGGEAIVLHCRDEGGRFIDTFIEEEIPYSDPFEPYAVQGEMQHLLDDNDNDTGNNSVTGLVTRTGSYSPITLYVPEDPGWAVLGWRQRKEPVLSALRTLAAQIGWDCRFRWIADPLAGPTWRLTLFDPDRLRHYADGVVLADDIIDVSRLSQSILGMRNVVRVIYASSEGLSPAFPPFTLPVGITGRNGWWDLDGDGQRMVAFVELTSTSSIELTGRRQMMETVEPSSNQIDTVVEATRMALGALLDLEEPPIDKSITIPCFWEAETNDVFVFEKNPLLFTGRQRLAVKTIEHSFDKEAVSTIELRGRPSIGFERWLRLETRQGGRAGIADPREALTDQSLGSLLAQFRAIFDRSPLLKGGKFFQVRNSDFSSFAAGLANPPDGWRVVPQDGYPSAWGEDISVDSSSTLSGGHAIRFRKVAAYAPSLVSDLMPVEGDPTTPYSFELKWTRAGLPAPSANLNNAIPLLTIYWYDAARELLDFRQITIPSSVGAPEVPGFQYVSPTQGQWVTSRVDGIQPPDDGTTPKTKSNVRFMRIGVALYFRDEYEPGAEMIIDDVAAFRTAREWQGHDAFVSGSYPTSSSAGWYTVIFPIAASMGTRTKDFGWQAFRPDGTKTGPTSVAFTGEALGNGKGWGFLAREDMTVNVTATVPIIGYTDNVSALRIARNGTIDADGEYSGGEQLFVGPSVQLVPKAALSAAGYTFPGPPTYAAILSVSGRVTLKRGDLLSIQFLRTSSEAPFGGGATISVKQDLTQ